MPKQEYKKIGMLGAGLMGAGIATVAATNGIEVVLVDRDQASAEQGKGYAKKLVDGAIQAPHDARRRRGAARAHPADGGLRGACRCGLHHRGGVREPRHQGRGDQEGRGRDPPGVIFASNTSTLPITGLAEASAGRRISSACTSSRRSRRCRWSRSSSARRPATRRWRVTLDFVQKIRKTPIVVNDSRGFFTSRVCGSYISEGHLMLKEGIPAAMIENAGKLAGMPVGPLSLADEVAIDLRWKIMKATEAARRRHKPNAAGP